MSPLRFMRYPAVPVIIVILGLCVAYIFFLASKIPMASDARTSYAIRDEFIQKSASNGVLFAEHIVYATPLKNRTRIVIYTNVSSAEQRTLQKVADALATEHNREVKLEFTAGPH